MIEASRDLRIRRYILAGVMLALTLGILFTSLASPPSRAAATIYPLGVSTFIVHPAIAGINPALGTGVGYCGYSVTAAVDIICNTDIGSLTNTLFTDCPTTVNRHTMRTVPYCTITYKIIPGAYNGTTTISTVDDWYISLEGERPSSFALQDPATAYSQIIDIESNTGVVQVTHNPVTGLGGGMIYISDLSFRTKTSITCPLVYGCSPAANAVAVLQLGSAFDQISTVKVTNVAVRDDSGANGCFVLQSNGGDDLVEEDNIRCQGTTNQPLFYISSGHFDGVGPIIVKNFGSAGPGPFAYVLDSVVGSNWLLSEFITFGTYNGILDLQSAATCTPSQQLCYAHIQSMELETDANPNGFGTPGVGSRLNIGSPTIIDQFTFGGMFPINMFNDSRAVPNISTNLVQLGSYAPFSASLIGSPFNSYGINLAPNRFSFGIAYGGNAAPVASRTYIALGVPLYVSSTGGIGISITVADVNGNPVLTGLATIGTPFLVPEGYTINFGAFTVAPTVKVWATVWYS